MAFNKDQWCQGLQTFKSLSSMDSFPVSFQRGGGLCFLITSQLRCQCRIAEREDKGCRGFCGLLTVQGTVTSLSDGPKKVKINCPKI